MKAIVAGGAGFLGSHLIDKLIAKNYQVICVDNLLTGDKKNIEHLLNNPNFKFIEADITQGLNIKGRIDFIYHLASPASPNQNSPKSYHALPFETMGANTTGTWNLCDLALDSGAKLLFASTSEAYGDPLVHPQTEEYRGNVSTTGPRSIYDESKRFGETIVAAFVRSKNLDGRIIRIFNTYGPRMSLDDGRAVIEFMVAAKLNKDIPVFGDGQQTRAFCYVSDLIEGIILAMEKGEKGQLFNLGNPEEFTILELAKTIKEIYQSNSKINFVQNLPQDDPLKRRPDITKAQKLLGFKPVVDLDTGLKMLKGYLATLTFPD